MSGLLVFRAISTALRCTCQSCDLWPLTFTYVIRISSMTPFTLSVCPSVHLKWWPMLPPDYIRLEETSNLSSSKSHSTCNQMHILLSLSSTSMILSLALLPCRITITVVEAHGYKVGHEYSIPPQTDGQTERVRVNRVMEEILRAYGKDSGHDWHVSIIIMYHVMYSTIIVHFYKSTLLL